MARQLAVRSQTTPSRASRCPMLKLVTSAPIVIMVLSAPSGERQAERVAD